MTNEQRLAIAEELVAICAAKHSSYSLKDLEVYDTSGVWYAIRQMSPYDGIVYGSSRDIIETIHKARQKLASERDAKKSEREKRLEEFALFVRDWIAGFGSSVVLKQRLDEALKEST